MYYLLQTSRGLSRKDPMPFAGAGYEVRLYLGSSDSVDDFSTSFLTAPGTRNLISMVSEVYRTKQRSRLIAFSQTELPCTTKKNYKYLTESKALDLQKSFL